MRNKINTYFQNNLNILLTLIIFSGIIACGCTANSTETIQQGIETTSAETTSTDKSNSDSSQVEIKTEVTTEPTTEEPTTAPLNYDELIDFDAKIPYMIKINRLKNFTTIYAIDKDGRYSIPYKVFLCSTGKNPGSTPLGRFNLGQKYDWRLMVDGTYAQYAIRISGPIMLHSVPYYTRKKNDLEVEEYAKLGSPASLGCIRYNVESIKWIYDNCKDDTIVIIYDSEDEEPPLELPTLTPAKSKGKKAGWDPTDPDKKNPWNKKSKKKNNDTETESSEVNPPSETSRE